MVILAQEYFSLMTQAIKYAICDEVNHFAKDYPYYIFISTSIAAMMVEVLQEVYEAEVVVTMVVVARLLNKVLDVDNAMLYPSNKVQRLLTLL